ncbi:MAG TPA: hypothetical protein VGD54_19550 [Steroidobacteraceae bacterium]
MNFYVRTYDQNQPLGPMPLSAAKSIVLATALAQRSGGSRVWATGEGKLFVKETGCPLDALWVTDEQNRVVNINVVSEFGTLGQQIGEGVKGGADSLVRRTRD